MEGCGGTSVSTESSRSEGWTVAIPFPFIERQSARDEKFALDIVLYRIRRTQNDSVRIESPYFKLCYRRSSDKASGASRGTPWKGWYSSFPLSHVSPSTREAIHFRQILE